MSNNSDKYISVFIPTYYGEKYLSESIEAILHQELPAGYKLELLVTDSGSKDQSITILKQYANRIVFDTIPNSEFGHGKTRQRAAERAKGEFILFLSQDATPAHYRWIINMIEPFFVSERVGCVFGRQIPRPFAVPTIKREVATVFAGLGAPDSIIIHREKSLVDRTKVNELNTFFSDVNSAIRKDLSRKIPFRDLKYAEDQALAKDMQNSGYLVAYSPTGAVWHSNEYTPKQYYYRKFDEYTGLIDTVAFIANISRYRLCTGWLRPTLADWKFTIYDQDYTAYLKLKYCLVAPLYNYFARLGEYMAGKYYKSARHREKLSLEARNK